MLFFVIVTVLACSDQWIPLFIYMIMQITCKPSGSERQIQQEVAELRRTLQTVNMVDQFAAYAKLQRKINSHLSLYRQKVSDRQLIDRQIKLVLNIILHGNALLIGLWICWNYQSYAILSLPAYLIWPLSYILAIPSCKSGEVSILVWMAIVRVTSARFTREIYVKTISKLML